MVEIIWSANAINELEQIAIYIALDSKYYSKKIINDIYGKVDLLHSFPRSGRIVPEVNKPNYRELIIYSYRVIYKIETPKLIKILTIHHSKRLLKSDDLD